MNGKREIYEALRDVLVVVALAISSYMWGMTNGANDKMRSGRTRSRKN